MFRTFRIALVAALATMILMSVSAASALAKPAPPPVLTPQTGCAVNFGEIEFENVWSSLGRQHVAVLTFTHDADSLAVITARFFPEQGNRDAFQLMVAIPANGTGFIYPHLSADPNARYRVHMYSDADFCVTLSYVARSNVAF